MWIYILIITDDFEKWIQKIKEWCLITRQLKQGHTYYLGNDLMRFEITSYVGDNCRGKAPGIILVDKDISDTDINLYLRPLLGHGGSLRRI